MDYKNTNVMDILKQINYPRLSKDLARVVVELSPKRHDHAKSANFNNLYFYPIWDSDLVAVFDDTNQTFYHMDNDKAWPILLELINNLSELERVMYGL